MPNHGLWYAFGPREAREAVPASAFSAGDVLCYTSDSSLSRMPDTFPVTLPIAGVARSSSTASINDKVVYEVPQADTVFWSEITTGSQMTEGEPFDLEYTSARFMVSTSNNTGTVRIVRGTQDVEGQSLQSRSLVKFSASALSR